MHTYMHNMHFLVPKPSWQTHDDFDLGSTTAEEQTCFLFLSMIATAINIHMISREAMEDFDSIECSSRII